MSSKQKIVFRADASQEIGFGHFMRTLTLANMLNDKFDCLFVTVKPTSYQKKLLFGIKYISLDNRENHFNLFLNILNGDEVVVLDNYYFTAEYQKAIKVKGCKLVCIHFIPGEHYFADVIINQFQTNTNLFTYESYCKLCMGFRWALVQEPFIKASGMKEYQYKPKDSQYVVICLGGSDQLNLTGKIIDILSTKSSINHIDVITGSIQKKRECKNNVELSFHHQLSAQEIANLFLDSDLAVVSSSMICLEALASNITVSAGYYVNNQIMTYEYLLNNNFIIGLGDFYTLDADRFFTNLRSTSLTRKNFVETYNLPELSLRYIRLFDELFNS